MSRNYNDYSKNFNKQAEPAEVLELPEEVTAALEVEEEVTPDPAPAVEPTVDPEPEVAPQPAPVTGVVTAAKLNVRKQPSPNGQVVSVINKDAKVQIDTTASTAEWYKVYTTAGVEGYCMKKFITVK